MKSAEICMNLRARSKPKWARSPTTPNLTAEGQNEKLTGKVQKKVGQMEKVLEK
jgi:hypothetical protein